LRFAFLLVLVLPVIGQGQDISQLREQAQVGAPEKKLDASWQLFRYYRVLDRDSALYFAQINNQTATQSGDTLSIVKSYNAIGYLLREAGNFSASIENYEKGLELAQMNTYSDQVKFLLNNLALVYTYYGRYDKSLEYHFKSLNVREKENDLLGMSVSFNNIGLVYYKIEDYEKAIAYFRRSLNLKKENNIDHDIERNLINIGLAYIGMEQYENALTSLGEIAEVCGDECSDQITLEVRSSAGIAYLELKQYDNAAKSFYTSRDKAAVIGDKVYEVIANYYLAQISFEKENYQEALDLLTLASQQVEGTDALEWHMRIFDLYAELYEKMGDFEQAYQHKSRYSILSDSLINKEVIKNLANIQLDFQEQQTQEIIASKDFQIERRTQINLLLGGVTVLISALLFILYKNNQFKKKANEQLSQAKDIIENQNKELTNVNAVLEERVKDRTKELKEANVALKKSNEELDNFIYKTSHDIRGPLATLMGVCNIAQIDVKDQQALDYFDKLSITAFRLNEILSKLLIINQINNTALQPEEIKFCELIEELVIEHKSNFNNPEIEISKEIDSSINFVSDHELLRVIYGNLINNAIKFRDTSDRRQSFINLSVNKKGKHIVFLIVDNGIGISEVESEKIFEVFSKASDFADSSGIGLYLVKLAVEKLNGSITHGTTEDGHTFFEVRLPA